VRLTCGRFRWAACQLEILGQVHSRPEIRKALRELPETLEATYERILEKIIPQNRLIAKRALQILGSRMDVELTLTQLAEAVVVDVDQCAFAPQNRLLDPANLLEICICLIAEDEMENTVSFAHYTVAEYLVSQRISNGPAAEFKISPNECDNFFIKTLIVYIISLPYAFFPTAKEFFCLGKADRQIQEESLDEAYPLKSFAMGGWSSLLRWPPENFQADISVTKLIFTLFDARRQHFLGWESQMLIRGKGVMSSYFKLKSASGDANCITLSYICCFCPEMVVREFLQQTAISSVLNEWLEPCYDYLHEFQFYYDVEGPPLQIAAMLNEAGAVNALICHGANPNAQNGVWTVLMSTLRSRHDRTGHGNDQSYESVLELLIEAGANPDPQAVCKTPLQLAVELQHGPEVVKMLLTAGAKVNAVGDPAAAASDMKDRMLQANTLRRDAWSVESYFDTPLRIAQTMTCGNEREKQRMSDVRAILVEYGGISSHKRPRDMLHEPIYQAFEKMTIQKQL
jgi:hypothetical protein